MTDVIIKLDKGWSFSFSESDIRRLYKSISNYVGKDSYVTISFDNSTTIETKSIDDALEDINVIGRLITGIDILGINSDKDSNESCSIYISNGGFIDGVRGKAKGSAHRALAIENEINNILRSCKTRYSFMHYSAFANFLATLTFSLLMIYLLSGVLRNDVNIIIVPITSFALAYLFTEIMFPKVSIPIGAGIKKDSLRKWIVRLVFSGIILGTLMGIGTNLGADAIKDKMR
jgi:hypothetical protein